MCQDQRVLQPAGGRTLCRAASVCSSPPSHLHLIENIIGVSKCPYKSSTSVRLWLCSRTIRMNTCYLSDTDLAS